MQFMKTGYYFYCPILNLYFKKILFEKSRLTRIGKFDNKAIISKGVGYCSQQGIGISEFLNTKNIKTNFLALDGHVVPQAYLNGEEYILYPDYGLYMSCLNI